MAARLYASPQALSLLQDAREHPEDDAPRLVLADWLEEHGDPERAEFIRTQCRLAQLLSPADRPQRGPLLRREAHLLSQQGGSWLGPLWGWSLPMEWHRGLLTLGLRRSIDPAETGAIIPWIDTVSVTILGGRGFQRLACFLSKAALNHLVIDLRRPLSELTLPEALARLPACPCLRTLTLVLPLRLLRHWDDGGRPRAAPALSGDFLARLLCEVPVCRGLIHLACSHAWDAQQAGLIRSFGVEPACGNARLWMHRLPPSCFRRHPATATS